MNQEKAHPRVERFDNLQFVPRAENGHMAQLAEITGEKDGTVLGTGFARLTNAHISWTVRYDEVVTVIEGAFRVRLADRVLELGPRDSVWLPAGTDLVYEADEALILYAIHPSNWASQEG
jgi:ethanolamine utilization protein EutQ